MRTGPNGSADKHVKEIKRKTRRKFSAEEKIRIVLDGFHSNAAQHRTIWAQSANSLHLAPRSAERDETDLQAGFVEVCF
jgi:hypothetical protein